MIRLRSLNKEGPALMVNHLEKSPAFRRWLSIAVALVMSAGIWAVNSQDASAATVVVRATNFTFTPQDISINVGDTVTWVNEDAESHAAEGGSLSSPEIRAGESFSHTFTAPEEISYVCRFHTYITGTISVVDSSATTVAPPTTAPPTTAPAATVAPTPAEETAPTTTVAPAPAVLAPTGRRGSEFQEVPDDPSARKAPGEASGRSSADVVDPTTSDTSSDTPASTPSTHPPVSGGASPSGSTTPTTRSSGFQDVPQDPSANDAPGQLLSTTTDEGDPPDDSSPPASPAGTSLGDGTVLAPYDVVNGAKEFHLTMSETTIEVSPGVVKQAYAFNGIVPGPVLRVDEGDRVRIVVDNQLPFPTSTHWHGMILPNDQDGVGGITQAHIEPGGQYVYEWTAVATGSHWYHAHSSGRHIGKGLYGSLEVVPREGDFESDRHYRFLLGDTDLGFTINGRSFPSTPTIEAEVGETVRLTVVNTGDQVHAFHLHGVPFEVVAQDGIPQKRPEQMDTLTISPGQTFDLLFAEVYPGKWVVHCHMFVHSHMTDDVHPPGESGMNGMTAIVNITEPDTASGGTDLLPIASIGRSDPNALVLVGIGALLAVAHRKRRRSRLTTQKS